MIDNFAALWDQLHNTETFEDAAQCVLSAALEESRRILETGTTILRAIVHSRPNDVYRGIVVREEHHRQQTRPSQPSQTIPSMTAWHWLGIAQGPVLIEVQSGHVRRFDGSSLDAESHQRLPPFRSRDALLKRLTTHVAAVMFRRPGGRIGGFLSVEIAAKDAISRWPAWAEVLTLVSNVGSSFLSELPRAPRVLTKEEPGLPVVGESMAPLIDDLRLFASTDDTLLLFGETGVGKSQLARWCCHNSARSARPFIPVNLATEDRNLRAATLFGWKRGAFTGAGSDREGLISKAAGGTLFVDEIDKLPLEGQSMLLSLLDDGTYRVIGESELRHADLRFIIGTNADLEREVADGRFLKDLYYRIWVIPVGIPPLRHRRDEIVAWVSHFIAGLHTKQQRSGTAKLEASAESLLERHDWPGNLRQLHNVIKRAYAFARRAATADDVWVGAVHVERALMYEGDTRPDALWENLQQAASAFVDQALQRDLGLDLDLANAFAGFVLDEAISRVGKRQALIMLGKKKHVESGNQGKLVKRKHDDMQKLAEVLGINDKGRVRG